MRLLHALRRWTAREAQASFIDDGLRFRPRLGQTGPIKPDIEATGLGCILAQFFVSGFLGFDFFCSLLSDPPVCKAASAANGEFSSDFLGRGAFPAE